MWRDFKALRNEMKAKKNFNKTSAEKKKEISLMDMDLLAIAKGAGVSSQLRGQKFTKKGTGTGGGYFGPSALEKLEKKPAENRIKILKEMIGNSLEKRVKESDIKPLNERKVRVIAALANKMKEKRPKTSKILKEKKSFEKSQKSINEENLYDSLNENPKEKLKNNKNLEKIEKNEKNEKFNKNEKIEEKEEFLKNENFMKKMEFLVEKLGNLESNLQEKEKTLQKRELDLMKKQIEDKKIEKENVEKGNKYENSIENEEKIEKNALKNKKNVIKLKNEEKKYVYEEKGGDLMDNFYINSKKINSNFNEQISFQNNNENQRNLFFENKNFQIENKNLLERNVGNINNNENLIRKFDNDFKMRNYDKDFENRKNFIDFNENKIIDKVVEERYEIKEKESNLIRRNLAPSMMFNPIEDVSEYKENFNKIITENNLYENTDKIEFGKTTSSNFFTNEIPVTKNTNQYLSKNYYDDEIPITKNTNQYHSRNVYDEEIPIENYYENITLSNQYDQPEFQIENYQQKDPFSLYKKQRKYNKYEANNKKIIPEIPEDFMINYENNLKKVEKNIELEETQVWTSQDKPRFNLEKNFVQEKNDINTNWQKALELVEKNDVNKAYQIILNSEDDIYLIRLMTKTGPCLKKLNRNLIGKLIVRISKIIDSCFLDELFLKFLNQSKELRIFNQVSIEDQRNMVSHLETLQNIHKKIVSE